MHTRRMLKVDSIRQLFCTILCVLRFMPYINHCNGNRIYLDSDKFYQGVTSHPGLDDIHILLSAPRFLGYQSMECL